MKIRPLSLIAAGALGALFTCVFAFAQDPNAGPLPAAGPQGQAPAGGDVPGRAARLGLINGQVSFQPGSVDDWVPATPNRPLTTGDRLWTEAGARAEIHLGSAAMRLNGRTNFSFINLDDRTAQMQLSLGTMNVRVRRLADDEVIEVDTPQAALSLLRPGEYRIDVNEQGDTSIVTVRSGEVEATAGQAFTIRPRQQVRIVTAATEGAAPAPPTFDQRDAPPGDAFDNWCQDRDRREDMSQSARYVSRDMPGYADLDGAGSWRTDPAYGSVWVPGGVPVGWAPYRYGHWAWIAPWGWTWVDDAAWGYAPFHYGRWVFVGGAWGWVPGPVVVAARPVYAPALVAFVGGPSFGVSIGIGGGAAVGWFALGPREVFVPAYGYSPAYIERVNVTNTVIVNRTVFAGPIVAANFTYANRGVAGAVVAVPGAAFVGGHPIGAEAVVVRPEFAARAQVGTFAGVAPQREAVLGGRAVTTVVPPAAVVNRTVVTRVAPPPPPVPFAHQAAALEANQGRPLNTAAVAQIRQSSPPPQRVNFRPATPGTNAGGTNIGGNPGGANPGANSGGAAPSRPALGNTPVNNGLSRPATVGGQPGNPQPVARPVTPTTPTTPERPVEKTVERPAEHPAERTATHPPAKDTKKTQKRTEKEKEKP